jgi:hypothetical protein
MSVKENFEESLQMYRTPLFLLTTATFTTLLAKLFTDASVGLTITLGFFVLGALSLLAAGVSAAYTIARTA